MKQTYQIGEANIEWFADYITKINKRAVKLGQKEITYKVIGEQFITHNIIEEGETYEVVTLANIVEVEAEVIQVKGYRFVASLEHTYENGNLVHSVEDVELPQKYHTVDGICEHCNTNRRRKITVVLQDENGNFLQIGRSCLKDFIGYDVEAQLKYMDLLQAIGSDLEERDRSCGGSIYVPYVELAEYLNFVEEEIDENGWRSKSSVEEPMDATCHKAEARMCAWRTKNKDAEQIAPSEFVQQAIEWIRTTEDTSREYMMNLQIMCKNEYVRVRDMGYVASLLSTYKKHLEFLRRKELEAQGKADSKHVGEIGKRVVFNLTLQRYHSYDTMYGTTWIYVFTDEDGNCIVWKSSKCISTNEGESVKLKGTIKEHNEFNGQKQTIITRCAEVK